MIPPVGIKRQYRALLYLYALFKITWDCPRQRGRPSAGERGPIRRRLSHGRMRVVVGAIPEIETASPAYVICR